jgi:DNA-binding transcriptional LysR family regulator
MNLKQLRAFYFVVKYGSLLKAAGYLKLTPAAISLQLKALEAELRATIFDRAPNKLILTEKGRILLREVNNVFDALTRMQEAVKEGPDTYSGKITLAFGRDQERVFAPVIADFSRKHPELKISIYSKTSAEAISLLLNGDLDLGISSLQKVPRGVQKRKLLDNKLYLIFPRTHSLSKKRNISLAAVADYPLIIHPHSATTRQVIDAGFSKRGIGIETILEVGHCESIIDFVRRGLGVGFVHGTCLPGLKQKNIKWCDMTAEFDGLQLSLIYKNSTIFKPAHRALIEAIVSTTKSLDKNKD